MTKTANYTGYDKLHHMHIMKNDEIRYTAGYGWVLVNPKPIWVRACEKFFGTDDIRHFQLVKDIKTKVFMRDAIGNHLPMYAVQFGLGYIFFVNERGKMFREVENTSDSKYSYIPVVESIYDELAFMKDVYGDYTGHNTPQDPEGEYTMFLTEVFYTEYVSRGYPVAMVDLYVSMSLSGKPQEIIEESLSELRYEYE